MINQDKTIYKADLGSNTSNRVKNIGWLYPGEGRAKVAPGVIAVINVLRSIILD